MKNSKFIVYLISSENKYKYDILWVVFSVIFIPISYLIFYYLLGSTMHLGIIIIALVSSKLVTAVISEIYDPLFGDKRFTLFLKFISYSMTLFGFFIFLFVLIRDANENQSVLNKFDDEKLRTTISKPIDNN